MWTEQCSPALRDQQAIHSRWAAGGHPPHPQVAAAGRRVERHREAPPCRSLVLSSLLIIGKRLGNKAVDDRSAVCETADGFPHKITSTHVRVKGLPDFVERNFTDRNRSWALTSRLLQIVGSMPEWTKGCRSRFATDQEPVKSRRESERRPTQEMTGDLKRAGRLAIRHSNSHRSNRNKNMEGLDLCPESSRWTCRCLQHIQPRKENDLEEDASFHRPAPVMSEDED
ncbi:hypothetical protein CAPTEDRAFT_189545 [Capitella teleta]|uniref:Uncharacterized protein n=1 Tax=Capitella teleta TaxID=283909 RepID=R7UP36_CAPTE|nr:hypothetical protein CAPTEDRAFT_189545 [Capitella teleta]|eukprot:ELU05697.1 hypothetical protein CAPTEDRAFT_189545 [Capitella teleta]